MSLFQHCFGSEASCLCGDDAVSTSKRSHAPASWPQSRTIVSTPEEYVQAFEACRNGADPRAFEVVDLCGRVCRIDKPADEDRLAQPTRALAFASSLSEAGFLGRSGVDIVASIGKERKWITNKVVHKGVWFKLAVFPKTTAWAFDWDGVFSLTAIYYPRAHAKLIKWRAGIEKTSFQGRLPNVEFSAALRSASIREAALRADKTYMTEARYCDESTRDTLGNARAFLWHSIGVNELFVGDGYTQDESGRRGMKEFVVRNLHIEQIPSFRWVDLRLRDEFPDECNSPSRFADAWQLCRPGAVAASTSTSAVAAAAAAAAAPPSPPHHGLPPPPTTAPPPPPPGAATQHAIYQDPKAYKVSRDLLGRVCFVAGPSDLEALARRDRALVFVSRVHESKLLGKSALDIVRSIGRDLPWIRDKTVTHGCEFKLAVFRPAAVGGAWPFTWSGVLDLVRAHYPRCHARLRKWHVALKGTAYVGDLPNRAFSAALRSAERHEAALREDLSFMTAARYCDDNTADTLGNARAFLWHTIGLGEQFAGDGWPRDGAGRRLMPGNAKQFVVCNRRVADMGPPGTLVFVDLPVREEISALEQPGPRGRGGPSLATPPQGHRRGMMHADDGFAKKAGKGKGSSSSGGGGGTKVNGGSAGLR